MDSPRSVKRTQIVILVNRRVFTVWQCDAGAIEDGLSEQVVVAFKSAGGGSQCVPDLLPALEGWRCIPELISLAAQLAFSHWVVTFPFRPLSLQGLVTP